MRFGIRFEIEFEWVSKPVGAICGATLRRGRTERQRHLAAISADPLGSDISGIGRPG
jgi:hypothetical protein